MKLCKDCQKYQNMKANCSVDRLLHGVYHPKEVTHAVCAYKPAVDVPVVANKIQDFWNITLVLEVQSAVYYLQILVR